MVTTDRATKQAADRAGSPAAASPRPGGGRSRHAARTVVVLTAAAALIGCCPAALGETGHDLGARLVGSPYAADRSAIGAAVSTTVTVTNPGPQRARLRAPIQPLSIQATDSNPAQTLSFRARGLPRGLSINAHSGVISGEPVRAGRYSVVVTASDTTGSKGSASFTWRIVT